MFSNTKLAKRPKQFLSITGLAVPQFDSLSNEIKKQHKAAEEKRLSKNRERKMGAGHKSDLPLRDRILMLLMYYRMYTTYDMLGMMFDLDKSNVMRDIRHLEPAARQSIPIPAKKYTDSKKITTMPRPQDSFLNQLQLLMGQGSQSQDQKTSGKENHIIQAKRKDMQYKARLQ